jgi:hypothetical protein
MATAGTCVVGNVATTAFPIGDGGPSGVLPALALVRPLAHPTKTAAKNNLLFRCIFISPHANQNNYLLAFYQSVKETASP